MSNTVFVTEQWREARPNEHEWIVLEDHALAWMTSQARTSVGRAISPEGVDAIFNELQVSSLLADIRLAASASESPEDRGNLEAVADFIESRLPQNGRAFYVIFLAD